MTTPTRRDIGCVHECFTPHQQGQCHQLLPPGGQGSAFGYFAYPPHEDDSVGG
jgi:hypothetical protein